MRKVNSPSMLIPLYTLGPIGMVADSQSSVLCAGTAWRRRLRGRSRRKRGSGTHRLGGKTRLALE